ncbi:MAG: DUF305 domain-containing protein [Candidatus Nanopelagicales bacterium]
MLGRARRTACSSSRHQRAFADGARWRPPLQGSPTDIAFAQSMIPHHQQAIEMADLALDPADSGASEQVKQLAEQIKGAQDPEIQQMTQWLQAWGAPTAMPGATDGGGTAGMDHSGHDMGGMTMSGMMTAEQMQQLEQARGADFDQMWLTMMIAHHQGAISMAQQAQASNSSQVTTLTDAIITGQQQEIATMQQLLAK